MFDNVYLVDNKTGTVTNMLTDDYTFVATANDTPDRFIIRLSEGFSLSEHYYSCERFAYVDNGKLMLDDISDNAVLEIYDVMGRKVDCNIIKGNNGPCYVEIGNIQTGLYIIKVSDKKGIRIQKIVL
jgi:hypothetical protein